jgi:hypothetical protein
VYLARDESGRVVVLKELLLSRLSQIEDGIFWRKLRQLTSLDVSGVSAPRRSYQEGVGANRRLYLVYEQEAGESLERKLRTGSISESHALKLARQVLRVLVRLHGQETPVVHGDIKPANILLRPGGELTLVDLAPQVEHRRFARKQRFAAPEQRQGPAEVRSDLFALGATLEEALGDELQKSSRRTRSFVRKLVAPSPKRRFQSALEALAYLDEESGPDTGLLLLIGVIAMFLCAALLVGLVQGDPSQSERRTQSAPSPSRFRPTALACKLSVPYRQDIRALNGGSQRAYLTPGDQRFVVPMLSPVQIFEVNCLDSPLRFQLLSDDTFRVVKVGPTALSWPDSTVEFWVGGGGGGGFGGGGPDLADWVDGLRWNWAQTHPGIEVEVVQQLEKEAVLRLVNRAPLVEAWLTDPDLRMSNLGPVEGNMLDIHEATRRPSTLTLRLDGVRTVTVQLPGGRNPHQIAETIVAAIPVGYSAWVVDFPRGAASVAIVRR